MAIHRNKRRAYNEPGHAHELTFSCYRRYKFLQSERTCRWLADTIDVTRVKEDFAVWAFVFMPEHVHLIVHPRRVPYEMSRILRAIKEPVGRRASRYLAQHAPKWLDRIARHRSHHVEYASWQPGDGYDRNITEPVTLHHMMEYIHLNPVRRGLVERPEQWRWSSAGWYLRGLVAPLETDPIPGDWTIL